MTPLELALYLEQKKQGKKKVHELQLELDPLLELEYIPNKENEDEAQ